MTRLIFSLCMMLAVGPADAATLEGPDKVEIGMPAVFTIKGIPQESLGDFDWQVFNKPADAMVLDLADRQGNPVLMFWTRMPCKCAIICDVNIPGAFELIVHEFVVGDEPQPNPNPNPNPQPNGKHATWGIIIEERDDRDELGPQRAMVMENAEIRKLFPPGQFQVRDDDVFDGVRQTPVESRPKKVPEMQLYIDRARKLGLPSLFLVGDDGVVVWEGAVPEDVPATLELIREYIQ